MATEIQVPVLGESVSEAIVATWLKQVGDTITADEPLVELETDKVTLEVPAPSDGVLVDIAAKSGDTVEVGHVLGMIGEAGAVATPAAAAETKPAAQEKLAQVAAAVSAGVAAKSQPAAQTPPQPAPATGGAAVAVTVPTLGESVSEAIVATWLKSVGDTVSEDDAIVELETDKVTLEVPSPSAGVLQQVVAETGASVTVGQTLALVSTDGSAAAPSVAQSAAPAAAMTASEDSAHEDDEEPRVSPAARKLIEENGLNARDIEGTGAIGLVTKGDVLKAIEAKVDGETSGSVSGATVAAGAAGVAGAAVATTAVAASAAQSKVAQSQPAPAKQKRATVPPSKPLDEDQAGREERQRMSRLRTRIAERLKYAQDTAAILTTYNEADMGAVMALRKDYRDAFEKRHGVRLGFMSFFVKACCAALKEIPAVNAEIQGDELVYKNYYNIGVAVGTEEGLVVPVLKDADRMGFAEVETTINDFGARARDGKLGIDEMMGGTFTISNGGVYGSLMSAPILNPPQSGILGMHKIQQRPVVIDGEIVARPMMYLALSYDHRVIDGKEAVTFLVKVKEALEDPQRLMLDL